MNGSFFQNPTFPTIESEETEVEPKETNVTNNDDICHKKAKIYVSFANNSPWQNKIYECTIESNANDYIYIKDINNINYLIKKSNIDYIEFI